MMTAHAALAVLSVSLLLALPLASGEAAPSQSAPKVATQLSGAHRCFVRCAKYKRSMMGRRSCIAVRRTCLGRRH